MLIIEQNTPENRSVEPAGMGTVMRTCALCGERYPITQNDISAMNARGIPQIYPTICPLCHRLLREAENSNSSVPNPINPFTTSFLGAHMPIKNEAEVMNHEYYEQESALDEVSEDEYEDHCYCLESESQGGSAEGCSYGRVQGEADGPEVIIDLLFCLRIQVK